MAVGNHGPWCGGSGYWTKCPVCGQKVYYYRCDCGSSVFFDGLGDAWPKHPCTDAERRRREQMKRQPTFPSDDSPAVEPKIEISGTVIHVHRGLRLVDVVRLEWQGRATKTSLRKQLGLGMYDEIGVLGDDGRTYFLASPPDHCRLMVGDRIRVVGEAPGVLADVALYRAITIEHVGRRRWGGSFSPPNRRNGERA